MFFAVDVKKSRPCNTHIISALSNGHIALPDSMD